MTQRTIHNVLLVAAIWSLSVAPVAATQQLVIDPSHSEVNFKIRHLMSRVTGEFGSFQGEITMAGEDASGSSVSFTIDTASIDTGVADRDQHLRSADFFDVESHPEITFRSHQVRNVTDGRYLVIGTLTMRGVAKEITLPVEYLGQAKDPWGKTRAGFSTEITLNRKDFGISWNKALDEGGYILGDDVDVEIHLEAILQEAAAAR